MGGFGPHGPAPLLKEKEEEAKEKKKEEEEEGDHEVK